MGKALLRRGIKVSMFGTFSFLIAIPLATWSEPFLTDPLEQGLAFIQSRGVPLHPLDEKGVPQVYYLRLGKAFDNPVYVCMYAYGYYQLWKASNEYDYFLKYYALRLPKGLSSHEYRECFFSCADWLASRLKPRELPGKTFYVWEYSFPWEVYNLEPPWISGMAQGCGIEVLVRAYRESGNSKYLDAARKALTALSIPVESGGVLRKDSEDAWWYEEYASSTCKESRVLNGMAHTLIGIYHYWKETGDPQASELFRKGLQALKQELPKYDTGQWTYYDQLGQIAKLKYHHININTVEHLGQITGEKLLIDTAQRWKNYRSDYFTRYFIWQKPLRFYTVLFSVNIILVAVFLSTIYLGVKYISKICGKNAERTPTNNGR
jgi:hypothetical protein